MNTKYILFDLDGTLANPLASVHSSIEYAFKQQNKIAPSLEMVKERIGPPIHESILLWLNNCAENEKDRIALQILNDYRKHQAQKGIELYLAYSEIGKMLEGLGQNYKICLATSKLESLAIKVIELLGFTQFFHRIYGSLPNGDYSHKPQLIKRILSDLKAEPNNTVMVGDRKYDVEGALANGVYMIAVGWGFGSKNELKAAGAHEIYESVPELAKRLATF